MPLVIIGQIKEVAGRIDIDTDFAAVRAVGVRLAP